MPLSIPDDHSKDAGRPLSIVFAGTPEFAATVLQALLETPHQIRAVYTQPDRRAGRGRKLRPSPVKTCALAANLPVMQPESLRDEAVQSALTQWQADIMVVVAYGLILPPAVLTAFPLGCINVHASLLPRWRGAAPIQRAIEAGDTTTGITIMQMDKGLDTGDMLATQTCAINADDTAQSLHDRLAAIGASLLCATLPRLQAGELSPQAQDDTQANYAAKIVKDDACIDWRRPASAVDRQIRAFNPWPGAFTRCEDEVIKIWQAQVVSGQDGLPGTVIAVDKNGIDVNTGQQILRITQLQLPGGKPLAVRDYVNGQPGLRPGTRFSNP